MNSILCAIRLSFFHSRNCPKTVFNTVLRRVANLQPTAHFHSKTFTNFGEKKDSTFHCVREARWDETSSGETT